MKNDDPVTKHDDREIAEWARDMGTLTPRRLLWLVFDEIGSFIVSWFI